MNPRYGEFDHLRTWPVPARLTRRSATCVAVGADPSRIAILDNFCWGRYRRDPETLGSLVRAADCLSRFGDVALAFNAPFISGKDSLNNEFHHGERNIVIPPTLLISALGRVPDVRRCVTMDFKTPGNLVYLIGETRDEMGGSHYHLVHGLAGGEAPRVNLALAPKIFHGLHQAICQGLARACHDLSEGGLAVAAAEMAFAGEVGVDLTLPTGENTDAVSLFAETTTRFLVEVRRADENAFRACFPGIPLAKLGQTVKENRLRIAGARGEWVVWSALAQLKEAWQKPLRW